MAENRHAPERLLDIGAGLAIWRVHVDDLAEQALNAQVMSPLMFARLVKTIERDGRLESLPFCALLDQDGQQRLEIVSGHHRVRTARSSGLFYVHVLVDETGLSRDQIGAKQLAHNSISGVSDDELVRQIFAAIKDVDAQLEAFIDPALLNKSVESVKLPKLELELGYRAVTLVFLPHQADLFDKAIGQLIEDGAIPDDVTEVRLIDQQLFTLWKASSGRFRREFDARAVTVAMTRLIAAALAHLGVDADDDVDPEDWVPLSVVFGSALVPPDVAKTLTRTVAAMVKAGQVPKRQQWQALARLADSYQE